MSERPETVAPSSTEPSGGGSAAERCPLLPADLPPAARMAAIDLATAVASGCCPLATPLDERIRFETLMSNLSAAFVNRPAAEVDAQIEDALRQVVEFLPAERSSFAVVSPEDGAIWLTHTYVVPGFPPSAPYILDDQLPWFADQIRGGEVLRLVQLPDDLPAMAVRERQFCERFGLKSQLTIPLKVGGAVQYAIGCAAFREHQSWPKELVQRLRLLGEVFANALVRKRADEELLRRERHFRELVESTRAVPWEADPATFQTTYIAPQVANLLGYPHEVWYREGFWASRLHPDDRVRVLDGIGDAVRAGRNYESEYRLVAASGATVWVHDLVTVSPEGRRPTTIRGVMIDITSRKCAEAEALRLRDQLARTTRLTTLGELAAAIAHEVNQPLCAIVSNAETTQGYLTRGDASAAELQEVLRDIVADGRRASEVIRRIRSMFQKGRREDAPFDLNEAIREVAMLIRHQLTRDSIALTLDLAADLPPVVGDLVQVQQVVLNLALNAVEAVGGESPDRRRVSVATARTGDAIATAVRDLGPGIDPNDLDQIFDAFFTTKAHGTGIGLSISRTIVVAHGGRIWAESTPGQGAAIHFTLPFVAGPTP